MFLERGQRAAQPVRLQRGKSCADDGDLHRLFLKQRHAQCLAQHRPKGVRRKRDLLRPVAPPQIGVDHIPLNGAGPNDRHLYNQIVELARLHPRQEIHLRAAFHLKHSQTVGAAEHIIGARVFGGQGGKAVARVVMRLQQIKGLADTGQHSQRQNIDLEDAQCVDIVLVPADHGAIFHRCVLNRHQRIKPPFGDDEAADML